MVYIFGYGSLIDTICRRCTFPSQEAYPARLYGFQRSWGLISGTEHPPLVVCPVSDATVNGVLIPFDPIFFPKLDEREVGYQRLNIPATDIQRLDGHEIEGDVYVYVVEQLRQPTEQTPILQTYLDICLQGCLDINRHFADEFIQSTYLWGVCLNDRLTPRYPRARAMTVAGLQLIDQLIARIHGYQRIDLFDDNQYNAGVFGV
ncbi:gamma-glutamylcyclotransferase family protein [Celerinatantimonas sp. YJH-8]|uniref:gamma-glutamylcyclotransferase family protein n=1 Tax=Celerinatantimonas sp. YJH-8 TaxID=3228714 RepID=UPI0038C1B792